MSKGLFITGTGTDIGKTYVTALLIKLLRQHGYPVGYYKAAISGASSVRESDAGYVNRIANIGEKEDLLLSYLYSPAVSPHLAAKWTNRPIQKEVILQAWEKVSRVYPYVTVEGSGGIVCPLREEGTLYYSLTDLLHWLNIPALIVSPAGLGAINGVVLTAFYLRQKNLPVAGVILNHYTGSLLEKDNLRLIEKLTALPVVATVKENAMSLDGDIQTLSRLYQ